MRKQYHFRPGAAGLRAWDIDRLVALASHLKPQRVSLSSIHEIDEAYWGGAMTCRAVAEHARLIGEANLDYAIILSNDGRIMDGMHRVLKALNQGETHIAAVRFVVDPEPAFVGIGSDDLPYDTQSSKEGGP
jgi:hypothetical protein